MSLHPQDVPPEPLVDLYELHQIEERCDLTARAIPLCDAFPEVEDREPVLAELTKTGSALIGGGAAPLVMVTLSGVA